VVIAENYAGKSEPSNECIKRILPSPPQVISKITPFDDYFEILWDQPEDRFEIDQYRILRGTSQGNMIELDAKLSSRDLKYQDYDVKPGIRYFYRIDAFNTSGTKSKGLISTPVILTRAPPPSPPTNPSIVIFEEGVQIKWNHPIYGNMFVDKYCIYREDQQKNVKLVCSLSTDHMSYLDNDVMPSQSYSYSISALNKVGESDKVPIGTIKIPTGTIPEIKKWEKETTSLAKKDYRLFSQATTRVLQMLLEQPSLEIPHKDKEALQKIKELFEGLKNE